MAQDTTAYNEVLKTVYEGGIRELIPNNFPTLMMFEEKDASPWGGKAVEYPLKVGRNQGSGWGTELGNLPSAGRQQYALTRIPMRYQYGRISLSAQVMAASEGAKNAFAPAMEQETEGLIKDMRSARARMIFGDGRGVLALINGAASSTTQTLDSPQGVAGATNGNRFIAPGMQIAMVNPATGLLRSSTQTATVVTAPAAGTTITITPTLSTSDNDYVVRIAQVASTDVSDSSYQKEAMGLLGLLDDGTYVATLHNINRTTQPLFQAKVIANVGALSADVLQRGIDLADEIGDGDISDLIMHHSLRRAYMSMMEGDRRYQGADLSNPDAGTRAAKKQKLSFGGIPITVDKYAPYGIIFGCDRTQFRRWVLKKGEWMDEDGSILQRIGTGVTAQDAFEAVYRIWDNFSIEKPNTGFRLDGVTATVVVAHID